MATQLSEQIVSFFTADVSGLESADRKQEAITRKAIARERELNREADKAAAGLRAKGSTVASSLTSPMGAASQATEMLLGKLKGIGPAGGLAAGALVLVGKVAMDARKSIEASADALKGLNEDFRVTSNANTFSSAGEGAGALVARLRGSEELRKKAREMEQERDPYGYGTSFLGSMATSGTKMLQPLVNFANDPTGKDRENSEQAINDGASRLAAIQENEIRKQISESIAKDLSMTRDRLGGDSKEAEILSLQLARTKAIADAAAARINPQDQEKIGAGFDAQIAAARETQKLAEKQNELDHFKADFAASNVATERQHAFVLAQSLQLVRDQLQGAKFLTLERRRALELEEKGLGNEIRLARQLAGMRPGREDVDTGSISKRFREQNLEQGRRDRFDARVEKNDGLINIKKDMAGNILFGTDMVTGEKRGPSAGFKQSAGLSTGGLTTGGLNDGPLVGTVFMKDAGHGTDTDKGRTMLDAQRAAISQVEILNSHTPLLRRIADNFDKIGLA